MTTPQFAVSQKRQLLKLGLSNFQIQKLELTLPLAKAWFDAKVPTKKSVSVVLDNALAACQTAMKATKKLAHPATTGERAASFFVMDADEDGDPINGGAIGESLRSLAKACDVIQQAKKVLPDQTRKRTDVQLFRRIDKAMLEGFIEECRVEGRTQMKPYKKNKPTRRGHYRTLIEIYFDAIGKTDDNPDRAIRKYILWLKNKKKAVD